MALQKQTANLNFRKGLDTKSDPWQVPFGSFLKLQNSVFSKTGMLQKRNGFAQLPSISNSPSYLSTFAGNAVAIGTSIQVLSDDTGQWLNRGSILPVSLDVVPAVRSSVNIAACDTAIAPNGLACCVFVDASGNAYYQILDSVTGQILVSQTALAGANSPRAFVLGNNFIITFLITVISTPHLQYIAIPISTPSSPGAPVDVSTSVHSVTGPYDGITGGGNLYLSWVKASSPQSMNTTFIDSQLAQHNTLNTELAMTGATPALISLCFDLSTSGPVLYMSYWDSTLAEIYCRRFLVSGQLVSISGSASVVTTGMATIAQITSCVTIPSGPEGFETTTITIFYQQENDYPSPLSSTRSDFIESITVSGAGIVGTKGTIMRGVGIAGKAFFLAETGQSYLLASYGGAFQPTYFLIQATQSNYTGDAPVAANVVAKLAYENGGGYVSGLVLPGANLLGNVVAYSYLYKFMAVPVSAAQGLSAPGNIYGQAGVNFCAFEINSTTSLSQEIAGALQITGGFVWMYDGNKPVEHGFHVFPEDVGISTATGSGNLIAQQYYYYYCYAWTDAAGNVHRSAPSIPYGQVTTTSSSTNTMKIPTYRQTYKTGSNLVRIEIYRWSTAQQVPYLITSESAPLLNSTTVDYVTYVDTAADSAIIGTRVLYTFGGTVEDIAAPACSVSTLYRARMFVVDSEDQNLLWFSKVVIESVPVEFSDLLTYYAAPTFSAQGSTGPITALAAMDDKLVIFKNGAVYYITGDGPDNTGANSDYGDLVFITATVGCVNAQSVILTPNGLMFQSDKGIWMLGRDLSVKYVGDRVEQFNSNSVLSSIVVPGTTQVRFTISGGLTLMYDYYFDEWGTFAGIPGVSSTVYQGRHTFLNSLGQIYQESPGIYVDGSQPVLMSFTTSWINIAGLQGYQKAYEFFLLGNYLSPHLLQVQIAYDREEYFSQQTIIHPDNYSGPFGEQSPFGNQSVFGGPSSVEQWGISFDQMSCQTFQISVTEIYDPSFGVPAGAGLTISGLDIVYGVRKGYPRLPDSRRTG